MPDSVEQRLGATQQTYRGHTSWIEALAWSPDSTRLASGSWDRTVRVWDAATGHTLATYRGHSKIISAIAWSPDGAKIASTDQSYPGIIQIWDAATAEETRALYSDTAFVYDLAWSPDGAKIASTGSLFERLVHIWDAQTGEQLLTYHDHPSAVRSVSWSPDSTRVVSASREPYGTIQVWDAATGQTLLTLSQPRRWTGAYTVTWSPNGQRIAATIPGIGIVQVWDAAKGRQIASSHHSGHAIAWSPNSQHLACATSISHISADIDDDEDTTYGPPRDSLFWKITVGGDKAWQRYQESQRRDPRRLHYKICIARTAKITGPAVLVWDTTTGLDTFLCSPHTDQIKAVDWSPDGARLASASFDKTVQVYHAI